MSAPLDLLSESLASSSSLINQLMLQQTRDERGDQGGPMASPLYAKESRQSPSRRRFQPYRRRRQTTTPAPPSSSTLAATRETLVYACPEPEGCPRPVPGQKYDPVKQRPDKTANLERPRDVLDTIYRQEVVKNKKVMRVRKKQRKPGKVKLQKESSVVPMKAVEMVSEMIKEAGPVLTSQEIEIIADVSQEVGAKVNEKQVKVISVLSEAMGPVLSMPELKTIAEVASTVEEDDTLESDATLEVVAEMLKSKVGETMTSSELEQIKEVMTQEVQADFDQNGLEDEAKQSGLTDHAAEMIAQMMNNIGSDASSAEVEIVADMIKELDKDVPKATAEVMAQVLVEVMPEVTPELVHNVSAVLSSQPPNLDAAKVEMIGEVLEESPPLTQEVSPEIIEMVAEMAVEEHMEPQDVAKMINAEMDKDIQESDVETIQKVAEAVKEQNTVLEEADLEVISIIMTKAAAKEPINVIQMMKGPEKSRGQNGISKNEAEFLSQVVKLFGMRVTPTEKAELEVEVKKAAPEMNESQAEVMTQMLVEMGPEVPAQEIEEMAEMIADPSLDIRADNVKKVVEMAKKSEAVMEAEEIKDMADMMKKIGPNLSRREMHMITRMTGLKQRDAMRMAQVIQEIGPVITDNEANLISMMTKLDEPVSMEPEMSVGEAVAKEIEKMGEAITNAEKKVVIEAIVNATAAVAEPVSEKEAEIVAEVIQEVGPEITPEKIEKLTVAVQDSNSIDTPEEVKKVMAIVEAKPVTVKAREVMMVSDLMQRMAMTSGKMSAPEMAQMTSMAQQLGVNVDSQEVEVIHEIEETAEEKLTPADAKLVEAVMEILEEDIGDNKDISLEEAGHLANVMNNLDAPESEQKAKVVMAMVKDMAPEIPEAKVEVVSQVLAEVGPNILPENVTEVVKLMTDETTADVTVEAVKEMADMARKMSQPMTMEQVEVIAEVKAESGPQMSFSEMKLAAQMATRAEEEVKGTLAVNEVKVSDVKMVVEMMDLIRAEDNPDKEELIAVITMAADQEVFSPDSSTRLSASSSPVLSGDGKMSLPEAAKVSEMIQEMEANGDFNDVAEEAVIVNEIMHMTEGLGAEEAETVVKIMKNLEEVDATMVKKVVEMVKDPEVDIKPEEVEAIAALTNDLPKDISPMEVVVVSNLASRMGPVLTEREKQMISRLAASSSLSVSKEEIEVINEVSNEIGQGISDSEAEIVAMIANQGKKDSASAFGPMMTDKEAADIADAVQDMGAFMSSNEAKALTEMIEDKAPQLNDQEVAVMTEVLSQVGPDVDADLVSQVAEIVKDTSVTPHAVDMMVDMAKKMEAKLDPEQMEVVVELIEKSGSNISPREMQMIQKMTRKANISLSASDVQTVEDMVNMLGRDLSPQDVALMGVLTEEMGKKEENANAEKVVSTLEAMDGRRVGLSEMQALEDVIEKMEPLMTQSKTQVMSQILIEADAEKIEMEDVKELAEIVMKASDSITPGDVEAMANVARRGDEALSEKEVKIVADMSGKFGDSLSPREVQMIARMMRSSGLSMTLNDIVMVAEVKKVMAGEEKKISNNDAKLIAKMTEIVNDNPPQSNTYTTTAKPFVRISMLPKKPTVSTLPDRPVKSRKPPRIKMNMRLKNRPPPRKYIRTTPAPLMTEAPAPMMFETNDGVFGLKDLMNSVVNTPMPPIMTSPAPAEMAPMNTPIRMSRPRFPERNRQPLKPTLQTLITTNVPLDLEVPEDSTQIKLEEFLQRNRPTPFRTFPSEDPPQEDEFKLAVTEVTEDDFSRLPGNSFMQITMGESNFGQRQNQPLTLPEASVSRDTLKSVAENFAFTKDQPNGMLMNFLMKKRLPLMATTPAPIATTVRERPPPTAASTTPMPMRWADMMTTPDPLRNLFNFESTTLDRSRTGNFIHMKMGAKQPDGVDPSVLPKLEKTKIRLTDGNSFMSMQMGDFISERMSVVSDEDDERDVNLVDLRRPVRKIRKGAPAISNSDRWNADPKQDTPFTMRPTLPVGQATLWPRQTPGHTPFTVRPTLKPYIHLGAEHSPAATPFTVRPTRRPSAGNYIQSSAHGDVRLKDPLENNGVAGYTRQKVRPQENLHPLQNGYMGIGTLTSYPGLHDDRPPYQATGNGKMKKMKKVRRPLSSGGLKASFGDLKFNLPASKLPDIPYDVKASEGKLLRDLPNIEQLDYEDDEAVSASESPNYQFAKSYLKNPYGADFIRLEIDANRYKHNKTRRHGGIHHIPLKIHGYAETSEFPVSADTEKPTVVDGPPAMSHHQRPKKQIGPGAGGAPINKNPLSLKAMKNAVENLPQAIHQLPDFMQSLWNDNVWPGSEAGEGKSGPLASSSS